MKNGCMKLMGVYAIGMATQPTAFSGIFDFGKGNSFGRTLIYGKRKQHQDELARVGKVASA